MEIKILEISSTPAYDKTIVQTYSIWPATEYRWEDTTMTEIKITIWSGDEKQALKDLEKLRAFLDDFENKTIIQESKG